MCSKKQNNEHVTPWKLTLQHAPALMSLEHVPYCVPTLSLYFNKVPGKIHAVIHCHIFSHVQLVPKTNPRQKRFSIPLAPHVIKLNIHVILIQYMYTLAAI